MSRDDKIDFLIAIITLIILIFLFSFQYIAPKDDDSASQSKPTGSGAQTVDDDSSVVIPSDGDVLTEPEYIESPKTGWW